MPRIPNTPETDALNHAYAACRLGVVGVLWSYKGIRGVTLGDTVEECQAELESEAGGKAMLLNTQDHPWILGVLNAIEHPQDVSKELPLDLQGTDFSKKVWASLRTIPVGQTRSYADVALEVAGGYRFARAVAQACARNPCAVLVPCHRVIRHDGTDVGYRWGLERKSALLAAEQNPS